MNFQFYKKDYYQLLCDFLIEINKDDLTHINWNWARLEWMMEHPMFHKEDAHQIGLWFDKGRIVAAAIFDMYFGEASCLVLKGYEHLYQEVLDYANTNLKDENGLGIAINNNSEWEKQIAIQSGFTPSEQKETLMVIDINQSFLVNLIEGFRFNNIDIDKDAEALEWLFYQGFDHGNDREAFEKEKTGELPIRPHLNPYLNLVVETNEGEKVGFCSMWYDSKTDYGYLEPLCVIPKYRKLGLAKALVYELLNRIKELGAKKVYVISDMEFYKKLGFEIEQQYTFYWKK